MALKERETVQDCPNCESRIIGKIGVERYYCHDCCVEFDGGESGGIYSIDDEGNLMSLEGDEQS